MTPGARLGPYEIQTLLGVGGMGEVYRARDTKLRRDVAIKILPEAFTKDQERLARFEREAQTLASLNHAHIGAIYGVEEAEGVRALVLELVEGETLADRLCRGSVPVEEALDIAGQIADALEAAHERGIIHRDLKPANVKVTPDGTVKVLDFGLAKPVAAEASGAGGGAGSTESLGLTREGMILGTVAYMSPEQARGKNVDKRTDVWAFGCVLYEMLTGSRAFPGDTVSDTIAAILGQAPDFTRLPAPTPPRVRRLLSRCLERDSKRRLRDIGDARIELEDVVSAREGEPAPRPAGVTRRAAISALAGAAVGAAATGIFAIARYRGGVPRRLARFPVALPEGQFCAPSFAKRVTFSPDGTLLALNTDPDLGLYTRALSDLDWKALKVKDIGEGIGPFFSPDSRWVGYGSFLGKSFGIRKLALSGGAPATVCLAGNLFGATWAGDDTIYLVNELPSGVSTVPAAGGQPKEVIKIDFASGERQHKYPCALPGGNGVLFATATADIATFDEARIQVFSPKTGLKRVLVEGGTHPRYSPSGHLLYAHDGKVFAIRFDPQAAETSGQPFPVLEGVLMSRNTGVANYDVTPGGDLAYVPGICDGGARTLVWVDRNGRSEALPLAAKSYLHPRLSPDNRQLAIEIEGPSHDLYLYDFDRGILASITTDGVSHWPVWSPDGTQLAYRSGPMSQFRLWRVPADRSRPPEPVSATGTSQSAESWSPDGREIAYLAMSPGVPPSVMVAHLEGSREAEPTAHGTAAQGSSKFSPDGHWLAYCTNESGKPQVYVGAYPGPGPRVQVSNEGGTDPVWNRGGGEIFYRNGDSMMVVPVVTTPTFKAARPRELWKGRYSHGMSSSCGRPGITSSNYDVSADGRRFLMVKDPDQDRAQTRQIVVVLGWADEVRRMSV